MSSNFFLQLQYPAENTVFKAGRTLSSKPVVCMNLQNHRSF